jgi:N-methylhydantoinase A
VEAIGVCLLWSIANPIHELRVSDIIKEEWPEISITISSELNPIIREYRRTSSTVINASLDNVIKDYVAVLEQTLEENGYKNPLSLVTSAGGIISVEEMLRKPIYSFNSGPSMAPIAGLTLANAERGSNNVLTVDMGGTSFDISVVTDGKVSLSRDALIKGYFLGVDVVDSISIGAGGGSIAWVDSGGLIHIGPESASSEPGPACYGLGGKLPTVTDADVVLGYLDPDYFLGGRIKLDPNLSQSAINEFVAKPLNLNNEEAAFTIWSTVNHNMLAAIQDITIRKGIDLKDYIIVSGGGAGSMHIQAIGKDLGIKDIIVPKAASALSAYGGAYADLVADFGSSFFTKSNRFDYDAVNRLLSKLEKKAEEFLKRNNISSQQGHLEFHVEARYPDQIYELDVPLRTNRVRNEEELLQLESDFHDVHERIYASKEPERNIECVYFRVRAIGKNVKQKMKEIPFEGKNSSSAIKGNREAYFKELGGLVYTPVFDGKKLVSGNELKGPALIEEPTTTIVVLPGAKVTVSNWGNYLMHLD